MKQTRYDTYYEMIIDGELQKIYDKYPRCYTYEEALKIGEEAVKAGKMVRLLEITSIKLEA